MSQDRQKSAEKSRERIDGYLRDYVPSILETVAMQAAKITGVIATVAGNDSDRIGVHGLEPSDLYRMRYEVATAAGSYFMFVECNLFRMRLRFGFSSDQEGAKALFKTWLRLLTGIFESNDWNVGYFDLERSSDVELRATIRLPERWPWMQDVYMRLAEQIAASMAIVIIDAQSHDFRTLSDLPDRVDTEVG